MRKICFYIVTVKPLASIFLLSSQDVRNLKTDNKREIEYFEYFNKKGVTI